MRISTRGSVLLASTCLIAAVTALGQQSNGPGETAPVSADLSVTYSVEESQLPLETVAASGSKVPARTWGLPYGRASAPPAP